MQVTVRVSGVLAQKMQRARFSVTLSAAATIQDLCRDLQIKYPELTAEIGRTVAVVDGTHCSRETVLAEGQEVALLLPVAGGHL